jgi:hypothetical protein
MGCLIALFALLSPRLALIVVWLTSDILSRSFGSWIVPLIGFFVLPWSTLTYAAFWEWGPGHGVEGFEWLFVVLGFLLDIGAYGSGRRARG